MVDLVCEEAVNTCAELSAANVRVLRELGAAIREIPLEYYGNLAGPQVRHVLDFYRCFLTGKDGAVDYEARLRDRDVETKPQAALELIERMTKGLEGQAGEPMDGEVWVAAEEAGVEGGVECGSCRRWLRSSRGRELEFLRSHSIHHMAIIRVALKDRAALPESFGVATSTLRHRAAGGK
jgi:hypothetical protein